MKIKEETIYNASIFLYILSYSLMQIDYSSNINMFSRINLISFYIIIMSFFLKCISNIKNNKFKLKDLFLLIFCLVSFISYISTKNHELLVLAMILYIINNTNGNIYLKILFISQLASILLINASYIFGLSSNIITYSNGIKKQSFGFVHANTFAFSVLNCQLLYCANVVNVNNKKIPIIIYFFLMNLDVFIYYITHSRTVFLLEIISLLYMYIYERPFIQNKIKKFMELFIKLIVKYVIPITLIIFICIIINFNSNNNLINNINLLLSKRVYLLSEALKIYPLNLFGHKINIVSSSVINSADSNAIVVDNALIYSLLSFGIITTIYMIALYISGIKKTIKDKNYVLLVSIIIFILSTFTEKYFIRIANNFTLLIMVYDNIWKVGRASDK